MANPNYTAYLMKYNWVPVTPYNPEYDYTRDVGGIVTTAEPVYVTTGTSGFYRAAAQADPRTTVSVPRGLTVEGPGRVLPPSSPQETVSGLGMGPVEVNPLTSSRDVYGPGPSGTIRPSTAQDLISDIDQTRTSGPSISLPSSSGLLESRIMSPQETISREYTIQETARADTMARTISGPYNYISQVNREFARTIVGDPEGYPDTASRVISSSATFFLTAPAETLRLPITAGEIGGTISGLGPVAFGQQMFSYVSADPFSRAPPLILSGAFAITGAVQGVRALRAIRSPTFKVTYLESVDTVFSLETGISASKAARLPEFEVTTGRLLEKGTLSERVYSPQDLAKTRSLEFPVSGTVKTSLGKVDFGIVRTETIRPRTFTLYTKQPAEIRQRIVLRDIGTVGIREVNTLGKYQTVKTSIIRRSVPFQEAAGDFKITRMKPGPPVKVRGPSLGSQLKVRVKGLFKRPEKVTIDKTVQPPYMKPKFSTGGFGPQKSSGVLLEELEFGTLPPGHKIPVSSEAIAPPSFRVPGLAPNIRTMFSGPKSVQEGTLNDSLYGQKTGLFEKTSMKQLNINLELSRTRISSRSQEDFLGFRQLSVQRISFAQEAGQIQSLKPLTAQRQFEAARRPVRTSVITAPPARRGGIFILPGLNDQDKIFTDSRISFAPRRKRKYQPSLGGIASGREILKPIIGVASGIGPRFPVKKKRRL